MLLAPAQADRLAHPSCDATVQRSSSGIAGYSARKFVRFRSASSGGRERGFGDERVRSQHAGLLVQSLFPRV